MRYIVVSLLLAGFFLATRAPAAIAADFSAPITNIDGTPLKDPSGKPIELTVRTAVINALMAPYRDEQNLSGTEKIRRADLARKIYERDPSVNNLSPADEDLIKKLVNKFYPSPLVVSQVWAALARPAPKSKKEK